MVSVFISVMLIFSDLVSVKNKLLSKLIGESLVLISPLTKGLLVFVVENLKTKEPLEIVRSGSLGISSNSKTLTI